MCSKLGQKDTPGLAASAGALTARLSEVPPAQGVGGDAQALWTVGKLFNQRELKSVKRSGI